MPPIVYNCPISRQVPVPLLLVVPKLLQCVDNPDLSLVVAEPSALVERYPLNRINSALDELKAQKTTDLLVFVPLNIPASQPAAVTANLVSPILINPKRRLGKQVVIENPQYSHRHHFL